MDISLLNCCKTCSKVRKSLSHKKCTEVRIFMRPGWNCHSVSSLSRGLSRSINGFPQLRVCIYGVSVCSLLCVCTLEGLIAEHKFRVWVTILSRMSRHFHFNLGQALQMLTTQTNKEPHCKYWWLALPFFICLCCEHVVLCHVECVVKLMKMFPWFAGAFSICMCFLKL